MPRNKQVRLKDEIALEIGLSLNSCKKYRLNKQQKELLSELTHYKARVSSEMDNTDFGTTKHYWIKEKGLSRFVKVDNESNSISPELIKEAINSMNLQSVGSVVEQNDSNKTLRIIITDVHVGMQPNENSYSLYNYKWDAEELEKTRLQIINKLNSLSESFEEVHLVDLGDLTDGFNSMTTRGGHRLPQNMTNREQFINAFSFKTKLLLDIQKLFKVKVKNYNSINCNHSSDLDYIVNTSVKEYLEIVNENIEVVNFEKFIDHYQVYNHTFPLTHGKDELHMKFGLKPVLDHKGRTFLEDYVRQNRLNGRITVEKGDSHVQIVDEHTSKILDYNSYIALSPPSGWVQHNFGSSKRGFNLMVVNSENNDKTLTTVYLD